jgi:hypothetical protein
VSPKRGFSESAPELPRARRDPMGMELNIDFVAYMWVMGILFVLVAVIGYFVVGAELRQHNQRREEAKMNSQSLGTWDVESPNSFGHR